jgi:predicted N-acetyltransferase YhbS
MLTIRQERPGDVAAREALLDLAYGPARFAKPSQRLREGRRPVRELSFVATEGDRIVGTVRLWQISAGVNRPTLLLGPLAVAPDVRSRGIGSALVRRALRDAARLGHRAVLLVGEAAFYGRFGFSSERTGGALDGARGLLTAWRLPATRRARAAARATFRPSQPAAASRAA